MALANFFDKAALAASEVLQGFDRVAFSALLNESTVGLAFDASAATSFEGRVSLELTANLLARLYHRLAIVPLEKGLGRTTTRMKALCRAINPDIEFVQTLKGTSMCVVVGEKKPDQPTRCVFIGSDGWVVRLSADAPVGSGVGEGNPFGAAAAACFGAANVFRVLFSAQLPHGAPDKQFTLSLIDFDPKAAGPSNPPLPPVIDIGDTYLAGLGAIGNGTVWALRWVRGLKGSLTLVDHEPVELTNLQRYVLATQRDREKPKVVVAAKVLSASGLTIHQQQARWGDYLRVRGNCHLERVAVALDSERDRIAVQAGLPKWVCNAWTQTGDLGVSRHQFLGAEACLACLYLPKGKVPNEDELVASAIKMPEALEEVRKLLYQGTPVGEPFVRRIATALTVAPDELLRFADKPLRAFYAEAVCGGLVLRLGAQGKEVRTQAPMAFQSALAGVLLAVELVADAAALKPPPPPTVTRLDLLRPLGEYLAFPDRKCAGARCFCQDKDYVESYKAKYHSNVLDGAE